MWWNAFKTNNLYNGNFVKNNQTVGLAFERAVGQAFGLEKNTVSFFSTTRKSAVVPDFVAKQFICTETKELIDIYMTGIFIEGKTSRIVDLNGSTKGQMKSMVDACANQISVMGHIAGKEGDARMYIVTPADTIISNDLISYATERNVKLYQFTAMYDKDDVSRIKLSEGRLLNPKIDENIFFSLGTIGEGKLSF